MQALLRPCPHCGKALSFGTFCEGLKWTATWKCEHCGETIAQDTSFLTLAGVFYGLVAFVVYIIFWGGEGKHRIGDNPSAGQLAFGLPQPRALFASMAMVAGAVGRWC